MNYSRERDISPTSKLAKIERMERLGKVTGGTRIGPKNSCTHNSLKKMRLGRKLRRIHLKFMFVSMIVFIYMVFQSHIVGSELDLAANANQVYQTTPSYTAISLLREGQERGCEYVRRLIRSHQHNHMATSNINQLRRELMMDKNEDTLECFEEHLEFFADVFESRMNRKHVMLHIPKAGGTSMCKTVRDEGKLRTVGQNCWKDDFCPLWIGCTDPAPTSCDAINSWEYADFLMNENWFDGFCQNIDGDGHDNSPSYSILLREPIQRTMSHLNHFLHAVDYRNDHFLNSKNWRLSLIQSNYMTWALSVGSSITKEGERKKKNLDSFHLKHPKYFQPSKSDLDVAMNNLLSMDYIIDLHHPNQSCINHIMNIMHIPGNVTNVHVNSAKGEYASDFRSSDISLLNELDVSLYNFAMHLIDVDCQFLDLLKKRNGNRI